MGRFSQSARRASDGGLAALQVLLEALLFAGAVAGLVFLLPGKFSVLVLSLYGFIVVGFLQAAALLILVMMLTRALVSGVAGADALKALVLCGGFIVVVALLNAYILMLGGLWDKSFEAGVDETPLSRFLDADAEVFSGVGSALAAAAGVVDRVVSALFHLKQPPLAAFTAATGTWLMHVGGILGNAAERASLIGFVTGVAFAVWTRAARGSVASAP